MKTFPILYSRTAKGAVNTWQVRTEGSSIITQWGKLDGKQQRNVVIAEPKNLGRSNATTAEEQAVSEAQSLFEKQLRKKYSETLEETKEVKVTPMLAQEWKNQKHKLTYPLFSQVKLDGLRCLSYLGEDGKPVLHSRGNKFYNLPHVQEALASLLKPGMVLDGELYRHGVSLQTINSYVRGQKKESEQIQYHIYDIVSDDPFSVRTKKLQELIDDWAIPNVPTPIVLVCTVKLESEEAVIQYQAGCVERGYEGCMVRSANGKYRYGYRSPDLLKCKTWQDDEFRIVGYQTGKGKFQNVPIFKCITESGATFDVTPKGTETERHDMLQRADSLIGQWLTVKYFQLSPDEQVPLYPVGISTRITEDLP